MPNTALPNTALKDGGDRAPADGGAMARPIASDEVPPDEISSGDSLIAAFLPGDWFLEFRQDYGDGVSVTKRGLDASPMVVLKYDLTADEVVAFSNADGRNRAFTAFHFHPDFPEDRRRHYMEAHREGYELADDMRSHLVARRAERRAALRGRFGRMRRAVSVAVHAAVLFLLTHYSSGR